MADDYSNPYEKVNTQRHNAKLARTAAASRTPSLKTTSRKSSNSSGKETVPGTAVTFDEIF